MIQVEQLRKVFGDTTAVDDLSFSASGGEIFGLLGPNGAGKTTTLNCICGLLTPTSGRIRVLQYDVSRDGSAARRFLGVVPQELALYEDLSAMENLQYWGGACGMRNPVLKTRAEEILAAIGLADRAKERVRRFSGGMKRRLNFGCGILHSPKLVLLDEPTVGVDPQSRVYLLDLVRAQARGGACVLYTTHYMEEAEALCDRLAIVDHGRIIAEGTVPELRALSGERDLLRLSGIFPAEKVKYALKELPELELVQADSNGLIISVTEAPRRLPAIFAALQSAEAEIREVNLTQSSLETLFIKLTGKQLRE
ncbi:MAG: ABC transporter ATP-binding protein [Acidobacteriaceae bacterium]|nr:ABC transporter ATP-binding protein [Acidobacteriaceae bacterium]MBV8571352.1 ABC transporter ATP-binding protein [Acidobacteriaceae bacterium]